MTLICTELILSTLIDKEIGYFLAYIERQFHTGMVSLLYCQYGHAHATGLSHIIFRS